MTNRTRRWVSWVTLGVVYGMGCFTQSASALDTPNVLMTIDGMTMIHQGLFRNGTPNDGFNTFQFGPVLSAAGQLGRYKSFYFVKNAAGDGGVSHNARFHSDTPEVWTGSAFAPAEGVNFDNDYYPLIDRTQGGQIFDPSEYQIEVKVKPNIGVAGLPNNTAPLFGVGLDQIDGFVWDVENGRYQRANDAFTYNIGSAEVPLNDWYAAAPKDADGFATWTVPVTSPNFVGRGFYYAFGNGDFRTNNVVTGGGKVFNTETSVYDDVNDGLDTLSFGGGVVDPSNPTTQLKVPNGVPLISFGAPNAEVGLSVQFKHITLKRINPGPIVARIDENSSLTFKFGSGLGYGETQTPINVDGFDFQPNFTDQISRFDQNGMTNLIFNMRTPNAPTDGHEVLVRGGPSAESFDGTTATVNVRAKLLAGNTSANLTLAVKDLDGNDNAANPVGGEEYTYNLDLSQFNTTSFTSVSIPLTAFTLTPHVAYVSGNPGVFGSGFANAGDGLRTDFNLYEFGAIIPTGSLLKMELDYMEIRLPDVGVPGDFDDDGDVDGRDFLAWQRGQSPTPLSAGDLATWKANYGAGGLTAATSAVPEPASAIMMLAGLAGCLCRRNGMSTR